MSYRDANFCGSVSIWDEKYAIPTGGRPPEFFRSLAADWRGWEGQREWSDISYSLSVSVTHDGVGHVRLNVTLRPLDRQNYMTGTIVIEPGQLDALAKHVEEIFRSSFQ